jgi:phosphate transport system substrate-binding protein
MKRVMGVALVAGMAAAAYAQQAKVDASIAGYAKTSGVSGNINSVGSDTMNNMMTLWAESFTKLYPNIKVQV